MKKEVIKKTMNMIDPRISINNILYEDFTGKSEMQLHFEWLRRLLITMQEKGVDDKYGDAVENDLYNEIKWLTDKIELSKRETTFVNEINKESKNEEFNDKEKKVQKLINDIAKCLAYPNDSCYPNVKSITREFEEIFKKEDKPKTIVISRVIEEDDW